MREHRANLCTPAEGNDADILSSFLRFGRRTAAAVRPKCHESAKTLQILFRDSGTSLRDQQDARAEDKDGANDVEDRGTDAAGAGKG